MYVFPVQSNRHIEKISDFTYKGIAFDGSFYYLTCPNAKSINKFDKQLTSVCSYDVTLDFKSICYDLRDDYFWASCSDYNNIVFKLNHEMQIVSSIDVTSFGKGGGITGLSVDCRRNCLLVALERYIICVDKNQFDNKNVLEISHPPFITGVLSLYPAIIVVGINECRQLVDIFGFGYEKMLSLEVPKEYIIEGIVFDPFEGFKSDSYVFYALCTKGGCIPCLCRWVIDHKKLKINTDMCNYGVAGSSCKKSYLKSGAHQLLKPPVVSNFLGDKAELGCEFLCCEKSECLNGLLGNILSKLNLIDEKVELGLSLLKNEQQSG